MYLQSCLQSFWHGWSRFLDALRTTVRTIRVSGLAVVTTWMILGMCLSMIFLARNWLGIDLVPGLDRTIEAVRCVVHFILYWLFFYWIEALFEFLVYLATLLLSLISAIAPHWPDVSVPAWMKDVTLVSIVLVRAFECAGMIHPPKYREQQRNATTPEQLAAIKCAQGPVLAHIHAFTGVLVRPSYRARDLMVAGAEKALSRIGFDRDSKVTSMFTTFIKCVVPGLLMAGYVRLVGYCTHTLPAWKVDSPWVKTSREMVFYFSVALLCSIIATIVFFSFSALLQPHCEAQLVKRTPLKYLCE